jgi:glutamate 5-kinase
MASTPTHQQPSDTSAMTKQQQHEKPRPKGLHSRKVSSKHPEDSLTIVIKLGTSSICDEVTHFPLLSTLSLIIETILKLKALGHRVVLVSSGAIGVGLRRMNLASKPKELAKIQVTGIAIVLERCDFFFLSAKEEGFLFTDGRM